MIAIETVPAADDMYSHRRKNMERGSKRVRCRSIIMDPNPALAAPKHMGMATIRRKVRKVAKNDMSTRDSIRIPTNRRIVRRFGLLVFIVVFFLNIIFARVLDRVLTLIFVYVDVGGGSVANGTRYSLARIPLRWMIRQCFILNTGILFHKHQFKNIGLDPDTLYPEVLPRPPLPNTKPDYPSLARRFDPPLNFAKSYDDTIVNREPFVNEEEEDMLDALAPMFDQLKLAKWWWVLECIPIRLRHQNDDGKWKTQTRCVLPSPLFHALTYQDRVNLGSARSIPDQTKNKVKVHRTVKIRMDAGASGEFFKDKGYETAAKFKDDSLWIS